MKRAFHRAGLVVLALLLLCGVANAQGAEIFSGQKIAAEFGEPVARLFRFHAAEGDLLTLAITPGKSPGFTLTADLYGPGGAVTLPPTAKNRLKAKKVAIPEDGAYVLVVGGPDLTTGATFKLTMKLKPKKRPAQVVAAPGSLSFHVPRGSELTISVKSEKGSGLKPQIAEIVDPTGFDITQWAAKVTDTKLVKLPCDMSGAYELGIRGLEGTTGNALVTIKRKPAKPEVKSVGDDDLIDTTVAKGFADGSYFFGAEVAGARVAAAWVVHPASGARADLVPGEEFMAGPFGTEAELDAAWPDGLYIAWARMDDFSLVPAPFEIEGGLPGEVTVTEAGPTRVEFTGGAGAAMFFLGVQDLVTDQDIHFDSRPAPATSFDILPGAVPDGWPLLYQVVAWNGTGKMTVHGVARNTGSGDWVGALSVGDLIEFNIDPLAGRYRYDVVEGMLAGTSAAGDMTPVPGLGPYIFSVTDDGDTDASNVGVAPGRVFVLGNEDTLIACVPARDVPYVSTEIQGRYNVLVLDNEGDEPDSSYGVLRIGSGTWEFFQQRDATGAGDANGTWSDQGDGVVHAFEDVGAGPQRIGNVMFAPSPAGGRLLVMDLLEGAIMIGVPQTSIAPGDMDGTYDLILSDDEDTVEIRMDGKTLLTPSEKIKLKFNRPIPGFFVGGSKEEPGYGLLSPDGFLIIGGVNQGDNPGEEKGWLGLAFPR